MTTLETKLHKIIKNKLHLVSRTYDYGHNDMQTDVFCKFCNTNQANYMSNDYRKGQRHCAGEWHKFDCIILDVLEE